MNIHTGANQSTWLWDKHILRVVTHKSRWNIREQWQQRNKSVIVELGLRNITYKDKFCYFQFIGK